jgi:hypothetical protein
MSLSPSNVCWWRSNAALKIGSCFVGLQAAEALLGLQHCGYSPSQSHPCIAPTFDIAADLPQHGHQTLDRVGAAERAPQFVRRAQADHGEHLVEAETPGAWWSSGRAKFSRTRSACSAVGLSQAWRNTFLTPACKDGSSRSMMLRPFAPGSAGSAQSQGVAHGPAQHLGSVNDEQVGDVWLQPALDQVGQQLTMAAFSVAPKATTSTCFSPAPSMPIAATSTWSPTRSPSIWNHQ